MRITVKPRNHPPCRIEGCLNPSSILLHQLCEKHYTRLLRHGDPEFVMRTWTRPRNNPPIRNVEERFYDLTVWESGCRVWTGARSERGYGKFSYQGRMLYAHRVAWELAHGPIPEGLEIIHFCDNPPCVWLPHLRVGTHLENVRDAISKGRMPRPRGENKPLAKITWQQADEIRERWAAGGVTQAQLSREYGIHNSTICRMIQGKVWVR